MAGLRQHMTQFSPVRPEWQSAGSGGRGDSEGQDATEKFFVVLKTTPFALLVYV